MTPSSDQLRDIVAAGVLAPSADNRHVFKAQLGDGTIRLWPTPEFMACTERHRHVLGWLAMGAVVQNMQLQARVLGWTPRVEWHEGRAGGALADLRFEPGEPSGEPPELAEVMASRCTNRKMYRGPGLTPSEQGALASAVGAESGVTLLWPDGARRRQLLGMVWLAESERFKRRRLHEELYGSIRFDLGWRDDVPVALAPGALEVEAPMRPLFAALGQWRLMQPLTWLGLHRALGLRAGWLPCWQAPALGVLCTSAGPEAGAVPAGMALQRVWLRATKLGLSMQPMAASAVLPLQSDADQAASKGVRERLQLGWAKLAPGLTPLMVFRLGRATPPSARSVRLGLSAYLANGTDPSQDESR